MNKLLLRRLLGLLFLISSLDISTALAGDQGNLVALDMSKRGASATINFHVSWTRKAIFYNNPEEVALTILPPKGMVWTKDLAEKYNQLYYNLTGKSFIYYGDTPVDPHKGINVRVTWKDANGVILGSKDVYSDDGNGRIKERQGASFTLGAMTLPAGDYSVTVEALENDPRFDGTFETAICVGYITY